MNWMTSAKNRNQRSKSKRQDSLRMVANSKLPSNKIRHSTAPQQIASLNQSNSKDMFLLCNLTRNKLNEQTPLRGTANKVPIKNYNQLDPLNLLEVSVSSTSHLAVNPFSHQNVTVQPARSMALMTSEEQKEDTSYTILYFNDGHLCDEFGNMVLDRSSPVHPQQLAMDTISRSDSKDSTESRQNESGVETGMGGDWWGRLLNMLEDGLDIAILSSVLEDLCASCLLLAVPTEAPSMALRRQNQLPAPREALNGLYKALSRIGGHDRASLVVFDAIRMLETEDKKQKDSVAAAGTCGLVPPTTAGGCSHRPIQSGAAEHNIRDPHEAGAVRSAEGADAEWCLFQDSGGAMKSEATEETGHRGNAPAEGAGCKRKWERHATEMSSVPAATEEELLLEDFF